MRAALVAVVLGFLLLILAAKKVHDGASMNNGYRSTGCVCDVEVA
jgi:hypothetical protein